MKVSFPYASPREVLACGFLTGPGPVGDKKHGKETLKAGAVRYSRSECLGWPNPTGPPLPGMDRLWLCALLFIAHLILSLVLLEEGLGDGNLF